jgi:hypothetical protein
MIRKFKQVGYGCDYCSERSEWLNGIPLTRKPNDDPVEAHLCDRCLADIIKAAKPRFRDMAA